MNVYIDTNVVLEAVLEQPEHAAVGELLALAEQGSIQLAVPVFVMYELENKLRRLSAMHQNLVVLFRGHAQSLVVANPEMAGEGIAAANRMVDSFLSEEAGAQDRWDSLCSRLAACSQVLPLTAAAMDAAIHLQADTRLHLQDAVVLATVLEDALNASGARIIVSRDEGWGADEALRDRLKGCDCELIGSIGGAIRHIRKRLGLGD